MTAVSTSQTPPPDLLLSLLTGMAGAPTVDNAFGTTGKPGEFVGLLNLLEGDSSSPGDSPLVGKSKDEAGPEGLGQLNSLLVASFASASLTLPTRGAQSAGEPSPLGSGVGGASGVGGSMNGQKNQAAAIPGLPLNPGQLAGPQPEPAQISGANLVASTAGQDSDRSGKAESKFGRLDSSLGSAAEKFPDTNAELTRAEAVVAETALFPTEQNPSAAQLAEANSPLASLQPKSSGSADGGGRTETARETRGRSSSSESASQWDGNGMGTASAQTTVAVTAASAANLNADDTAHRALSDSSDPIEAESVHRRGDQPAAENMSLLYREPAELNSLQASFESHLEQVAESFPLESVAAQIANAVEPDAGWITVEIQPPDLGKLEIMVSKQGDDYLARIVAHESATGDALSLQREQLIDALGQHGLELKEVQITSDTGSGGNSSPEGSRSNTSEQQGQETPSQRDDRPGRGSRVSLPPPGAQSEFHSPASSGAGNRQVNLLV
ncbi:MAG: flagellar hook-length control protein FliK [Planctomycetota bacterium]